MQGEQTAILSAIKKLEVSLRGEVRRGDNSLRAEVRRGDKAIRQEMLKIEERVEDLEGAQKRIEQRLGSVEVGQKEIQEQMRKQHDEVMTAVSNFGGRVKDLEDENEIGANHIRELHDKAVSHETRIAKLESTTTQ